MKRRRRNNQYRKRSAYAQYIGYNQVGGLLIPRSQRYCSHRMHEGSRVVRLTALKATSHACTDAQGDEGSEPKCSPSTNNIAFQRLDVYNIQDRWITPVYRERAPLRPRRNG